MEKWGWIGSIRSLCAFMIVGAFTYLSVIGKVGADQVISVVMVVLAFYFTLKNREENKPPTNGGPV